jgi:t-SNARE complex subunit (syntaxin)
MSDLSAIQKDLKALVKINKTFTRSTTKIGSPSDCDNLRSSMDTLVNEFQALKAQIQSSIKTLNVSKNISRKLQEDVKGIVAEFETTEKKRNLSERQRPLRRNTVDQPNPLASAQLEHQQQQQQQQVQVQVQGNDFELISSNRMAVEKAIAQEQHNEITEIQQEVLQTADLMKDIAVLINDQGETLDEMEGHVQKASDHIERGVTELNKAVGYQKAARKKKCIIAIILLLVLAAILIPTLTLTIGTKKK